MKLRSALFGAGNVATDLNVHYSIVFSCKRPNLTFQIGSIDCNIRELIKKICICFPHHLFYLFVAQHIIEHWTMYKPTINHVNIPYWTQLTIVRVVTVNFACQIINLAYLFSSNPLFKSLKTTGCTYPYKMNVHTVLFMEKPDFV